MSKRIKATEEILRNKTSSSSDLTIQINKFFEENSGNPQKMEKAIEEFKKLGSSFQSVKNYLKELKKIAKTGDKSELKRFFINYRQNSISKYKKIYENSKHLLKNKKRILTISNSRTVLEFLKLWHHDNRNLEVILAESRPMNEGRIMAKSLLKEEIKIIFIADFNISHYISISDAVITGADAVLKNGRVVNKTGSCAAAIICKYFKKPFYVLAGSDKFSKTNSYRLQMETPEEIWKYKHNNLIVKNNYFEVIEKKLITKIISEENL